MKRLQIAVMTVAIGFAMSCNKKIVKADTDYAGTPGVATDFVRASGDHLVVGTTEETIVLAGVGFSNYVWLTEDEPDRIDAMMSGNHHLGSDYSKVAEMDMNCVRLLLHHEMFDHENVWTWLDKEIADARAADVWLILNLHVAPGDDSGKLWKEGKKAQKKVISIWKAIAERYKDEPIIAAYDLINEPVVTKDREQYEKLLDKIIEAVREEDKNHLFMIEHLYGVGEDWETWDNPSFDQFLVNDDNVVYDVHFYYPFLYSLQGLYDEYPEGPVYPDPQTIFEVEGQQWSLDQNYLAWELDRWIAFGADNQVPMNIGEFAANNRVYANHNGLDNYQNMVLNNWKGGLEYLDDFIGLMINRNLSFQYHDFHSPTYGLYFNYEVGNYFDPNLYPSSNYGNQELMDVMEVHLLGITSTLKPSEVN